MFHDILFVFLHHNTLLETSYAAKHDCLLTGPSSDWYIAEISSVEDASRRHLLIAYYRMFSELTTLASGCIFFNVLDFYVSYFTTLNCSRSLLLRYGKIDRAPWRRWNCNRFPIQTRIFSKERVGEGGPFHLPPWRWSETERRGSVQRHLLLPLGTQGPVHLHTLVHETCYFNVLASRFDFEYCE